MTFKPLPMKRDFISLSASQYSSSCQMKPDRWWRLDVTRGPSYLLLRDGGPKSSLFSFSWDSASFSSIKHPFFFVSLSLLNATGTCLLLRCLCISECDVRKISWARVLKAEVIERSPYLRSRTKVTGVREFLSRKAF